LTAISAVARRKEPPISELDEATVEEVFEEDVAYVCDFEEGDKVVYPHHGAGLVMTKETRELMGSEREYLTIKILHNELTVMVPTENAGKAGLRRVIDEEEIKKVTSVLTDDVSEMPKKQMYTRAKKILASEFMYALDKDEDGAEEYLDGLLEERFAATASA
jgi:CarD family transcriptional regulator